MPRTEPTRDIFDTLTREHRDLLALLWDVEAAHARCDYETAGDLFVELAERLWLHDHAEAAVVHPHVPALARITTAEDLVEHVGSFDPASPDWGVRLAELSDRLFAQFAAEERQFATASVLLPPGLALELGAAYAAHRDDDDDDLIVLDDDTLAALIVHEAAA